MNLALFYTGLAKVAFGIVVGAAGIYLASRALSRLLRSGEAEAEQRRGNMAAGVLHAASLISLGLLVQHAVSATFAAMDLMYRGQAISVPMLTRFAMYALVHVTFSLMTGAGVIALGTMLFALLTRGVDEMAEVRKGNVAPALVLGAVMIVMAMMTAPGLQTALDGLLPLPALGRDQLLAPS
ncbi:MAG: DUF350 domain-containing protein [Polyangiaceae bacterium]|nr:DUF350 domain-containing protein [Polyangiaceae bacterium]